MPHPTQFPPTQFSITRRFLLASIVLLFFSLSLLTPLSGAIVPQESTSSIVPALNESLRPALNQAGSALSQVQIDRWKLSRAWKEQLQGDVNSIQQDLTTQLPALFQAAQQSPTALEPQLNVMHNVDALYDVLVRISTAANLAGGKTDAAILDNAIQQLELARKNTASQLLQAASQRDQQITRFQASIQAAQRAEASTNDGSKTIVVNNRLTHRTRHHKTTPNRKKAVPPAKSTGNQTGTSISHPTAQQM